MAMDFIKANDGVNHFNIAIESNNLAAICVEFNYYIDAERLYNLAYQIFSNHLGETHPHTIQIKENLDYIVNLIQSEGKNE
jgi:hypothetical protein